MSPDISLDFTMKVTGDTQRKITQKSIFRDKETKEMLKFHWKTVKLLSVQSSYLNSTFFSVCDGQRWTRDF